MKKRKQVLQLDNTFNPSHKSVIESVYNLHCENNSEIEDLNSRLDVVEDTYIDDLYREIKFLKSRIAKLEDEIKH
ncbi:MAG: hypothetical protein M3162_06360 [Thermoproteota archaeon]|nr:hypothetical protein [Thermoproteota archaeon]